MTTILEQHPRLAAEAALMAAGFRVLGRDGRVPGGLTAWQRGPVHAQTDDTEVFFDGTSYGYERLTEVLSAIKRSRA